jgi:hypothetical protein
MAFDSRSECPCLRRLFLFDLVQLGKCQPPCDVGVAVSLKLALYVIIFELPIDGVCYPDMLSTALQLQLFRSSDLWTKAKNDTSTLLAETTDERFAEINTHGEVEVFFVLQVFIQNVFHGRLESNSHVCCLLTALAEFFHPAGHMDDTEDAVALML